MNNFFYIAAKYSLNISYSSSLFFTPFFFRPPYFNCILGVIKQLF